MRAFGERANAKGGDLQQGDLRPSGCCAASAALNAARSGRFRVLELGGSITPATAAASTSRTFPASAVELGARPSPACRACSQLSSRSVSSGPADWHRFKRPGFVVEFSYPRVTPQGHVVEQFEEHVQDHRGDMERVHLSSPWSTTGAGAPTFRGVPLRPRFHAIDRLLIQQEVAVQSLYPCEAQAAW